MRLKPHDLFNDFIGRGREIKDGRLALSRCHGYSACQAEPRTACASLQNHEPNKPLYCITYPASGTSSQLHGTAGGEGPQGGSNTLSPDAEEHQTGEDRSLRRRQMVSIAKSIGETTLRECGQRRGEEARLSCSQRCAGVRPPQQRLRGRRKHR